MRVAVDDGYTCFLCPFVKLFALIVEHTNSIGVDGTSHPSSSTVVVTMLVRNKWNILKSIRPKRPSRNKSIISRMERHEWSFNWKLNLNESCKLFRSKAMHNQVNIIYNNRNTNANTTATIHQQQQNGKMDMDDDLVLSSCVCGVTGEWTMAITLSCGYNSV